MKPLHVRTDRPAVLHPARTARLVPAGGQPTASIPQPRLATGRWLKLIFGLTFAFLCAYPSLLCLMRPSIFYDDVFRIAVLHEHSLGVYLFIPFNEHLQPFFQAVTWVTYHLAGDRLANLPLAFSIATAVPFVASLVLLGTLVFRATRSWATAMAAAALASYCSISHYETVAWYSASSFQWSLAWTLLALLAVERVRSVGRLAGAWWSFTLFASALFAPASCALGVLTGPLAAIWAMCDPDLGHARRRIRVAVIPMLGLLLFVGLCIALKHQEHVSSQVVANSFYWKGLYNAYRAPAAVLVPALAGFRNRDSALTDAAEILLFISLLGGFVALAWRSAYRRFVIGGGFLIVANDLMIYGFRHLPGDDHWCLTVERYHLFPQVGLVLALLPVLLIAFKRFDTRRIGGLTAVVLFAMALLLSHRESLQSSARFYDFPEQSATLGALDHLVDIGKRKGITRLQVATAMEPIRRRWFEWDGKQLFAMMPETAPAPRVPGNLVRSILLAELTADERASLWGGMDATPYVTTRPSLNSSTPLTGALDAVVGMKPIGMTGNRFEARPGSYLEYRFGAHDFPVRGIRLHVDGSGQDLAAAFGLWWPDPAGNWSVVRSVRWLPKAGATAQGSFIPASALPHWPADECQRVRIYLWAHQRITVRPPELIR